jgi:hypothetical protein
MIILKYDFQFFIARKMAELNFIAAVAKQKPVQYLPVHSHTLYTKSSHSVWFNRPMTQGKVENCKILLFFVSNLFSHYYSDTFILYQLHFFFQ